MITKPLLWGGQGPYKDCGATDDDEDSSRRSIVGFTIGRSGPYLKLYSVHSVHTPTQYFYNINFLITISTYLIICGKMIKHRMTYVYHKLEFSVLNCYLNVPM
jgi:hypothetical protein